VAYLICPLVEGVGVGVMTRHQGYAATLSDQPRTQLPVIPLRSPSPTTFGHTSEPEGTDEFHMFRDSDLDGEIGESTVITWNEFESRGYLLYKDILFQ